MRESRPIWIARSVKNSRGSNPGSNADLQRPQLAQCPAQLLSGTKSQNAESRNNNGIQSQDRTGPTRKGNCQTVKPAIRNRVSPVSWVGFFVSPWFPDDHGSFACTYFTEHWQRYKMDAAQRIGRCTEPWLVLVKLRKDSILTGSAMLK